MKKFVLFSFFGVAIACWLSGTSSAPLSQDQLTNAQSASPPAKLRKSDMLGLTPGMSTEAARRVLIAKGWRCRADISPMAGPAASTCDTELGQLNLRVAQNLPEEPLIFMRLFFRSADTTANIARSIADQYGLDYSAIKDRNGNIEEYRWQLTPALRLSYFSNGQMLDFRETALELNNEEVAKAKELKRNPTPRF